MSGKSFKNLIGFIKKPRFRKNGKVLETDVIAVDPKKPFGPGEKIPEAVAVPVGTSTGTTGNTNGGNNIIDLDNPQQKTKWYERIRNNADNIMGAIGLGLIAFGGDSENEDEADETGTGLPPESACILGDGAYVKHEVPGAYNINAANLTGGASNNTEYQGPGSVYWQTPGVATTIGAATDTDTNQAQATTIGAASDTGNSNETPEERMANGTNYDDSGVHRMFLDDLPSSMSIGANGTTEDSWFRTAAGECRRWRPEEKKWAKLASRRRREARTRFLKKHGCKYPKRICRQYRGGCRHSSRRTCATGMCMH